MCYAIHFKKMGPAHWSCQVIQTEIKLNMKLKIEENNKTVKYQSAENESRL